jgi:hypothetical protein
MVKMKIIDKNLLMMAKTIKAYCQEIGKANLGGDCCNGCVFAQGGCVLNACPEEWRLTEVEKQETA